MIHAHAHRGFTLLIAVVLASVSLSVGLALLDIALKQVILSSSARQSQTAFYKADSAMECALYYDQQLDTFARAKTLGSVTCYGSSNPITVTFNQAGDPRLRTFAVPCTTGGTAGMVTVAKYTNSTTEIYSNGYNTCDSSNPRRIERGLKIRY